MQMPPKSEILFGGIFLERKVGLKIAFVLFYLRFLSRIEQRIFLFIVNRTLLASDKRSGMFSNCLINFTFVINMMYNAIF